MLLFCVHCATKTPLAYNETKTEAVTILAPIRTRMGYLKKWVRRETRTQKVWCLVFGGLTTMNNDTEYGTTTISEGRKIWLLINEKYPTTDKILAPDPFKEHVQDKKRRWLNWPLLSYLDMTQPSSRWLGSPFHYLKIFHFDNQAAESVFTGYSHEHMLCPNQFDDLSLTRTSLRR